MYGRKAVLKEVYIYLSSFCHSRNSNLTSVPRGLFLLILCLRFTASVPSLGFTLSLPVLETYSTFLRTNFLLPVCKAFRVKPNLQFNQTLTSPLLQHKTKKSITVFMLILKQQTSVRNRTSLC